jgi:hypothetical protein
MSQREPVQEEGSNRQIAVVRRGQGGDERGGFEISSSRAERVVRARLWGTWHFGVARDFGSAIVDFGQEFADRPWAIIADAKHFPASSADVARVRQEAMAKVRRLGCEKIAALVSSVGYSMQFMQITKESNVGGAVFVDEKSALGWIDDIKAKSK